MSNLGGGFAGGLADGIRQGQDMQLRQRQQDNSDKQVQWAGEDHQARADDRARMTKFRDEYSKLQAATYGEQDQDTTVNQDDGRGNMAPVIQRVKVNVAPGQDQRRDAKFMIDSMALKMRYATDPDPEMMMKASDYVQKVKATESGRLMMGALGGDKDALIKLGSQQGFDGASARIVTDPSKGIFKLVTSAGEKDLMPMAQYLGADAAYNQMKDATAQSQGIESHTLGVKRGNMQVDTVMPAQVGLMKGQTAAAYANADMRSAKAGNVGSGDSIKQQAADAKTSKAISTALKNTSVSKDDPYSPHAQLMAERFYQDAKASGNGISAEAAASQGAIKYTKMMTDLAAQSKKPEVLAKFGAKNAKEFYAKFFAQNSQPSQPTQKAGKPRASAVALGDDEGEE